MAIQTIGVQAPPPQVQGKRGKAGGAGLGQTLGQAAGAVAGGIVGGLPGAATGASLGGTLGGLAGGAVDPGRPDTQAAIQRRAQPTQAIQKSPETEQLERSLLALQSQPPDVQRQHVVPLAKAYFKSVGAV